MNCLLIFVVICGLAASSHAAQQQSLDAKSRERRRVPSSSYTRTEEGAQVSIPGLENSTDINTTNSPSEEGVTDLENTEGKNVTSGSTTQNVNSSVNKPATTPSPQVVSEVKPATTTAVPEVKPSSVASEPSEPIPTETTTKKGLGFLSNNGPFGLPIPKVPIPKLQPKVPSIPNIFGR